MGPSYLLDSWNERMIELAKKALDLSQQPVEHGTHSRIRHRNHLRSMRVNRIAIGSFAILNQAINQKQENRPRNAAKYWKNWARSRQWRIGSWKSSPITWMHHPVLTSMVDAVACSIHQEIWKRMQGSVSQLIEDASATSVVSEASASSLWWLLTDLNLCYLQICYRHYDNKRLKLWHSLWLLIFYQVK